MRFLRKRDPEAGPVFGTHPGDYGVVLVAFLITLGFIYLLLSPQDFGAAVSGAFKDSPPPPPKASGETEMIIYDHTQKK